jgi:hypothetical protein
MTSRIICAAAVALFMSTAASVAQTGPGMLAGHAVEVEPEVTSGLQAASEQPFALTAREREIIRRHARERSVKPADVEIEIGELLPEMELHSFSDAVQRKVPAVRAYRYFVIDDELVLVDPEGLRIVDVIDE